MTLKESLQIRNSRINIPVTVSGIYSHSKTSKCMVMYNLPPSKGTMTRILTLQIPKNRQYNTSLQSVQLNHLDYVATRLTTLVYFSFVHSWHHHNLMLGVGHCESRIWVATYRKWPYYIYHFLQERKRLLICVWYTYFFTLLSFFWIKCSNPSQHNIVTKVK